MIGKTISHYKILEKLGEGGMGQVYKAEDTKLKRVVALKFLPHHLVAGKSIKERFFHEARAASALNHPNIITIYDIHEEEDEVFLAMECVDGVLLSEKLKDGPLKQKELISIASGVANGLNAAHNADITHRDIKSENIIISKDGQPKIIDFGLAKQKGMSQITQDGTTLGTQGYMSPEQVQGVEADRRSDIFSFGVVLYQMATGKLPFEGEHEAAVLYSIVNEAPIPVTTHNPNLDEELQRIISKALEKDVKDRYQHADDLLADLRKLKKGSTPKPTKAKKPIWRNLIYILGAISFVLTFYLVFIKKDTLPSEQVPSSKSIAVLPFTSIDRTEESEIFSDGIHDDILTQIAKIKELKVIGRTSVMRYRNTEKRFKEIAEELNVSSILEGSVRRSGDRIRIVAQLIDPETEEHIWAETYDRNYSDIFAIQSDVAQKIAFALKATLNPEEKERLETIPTKNMAAYDSYLRGNHYWQNYFTKDGNVKAGEMYEKALELDPGFSQAYAKLSQVDFTLYNRWPDEFEGYLQKGVMALNMATKLGPDLMEVHWANGIYQSSVLHDHDKALSEYLIALKKQPNSSLLNIYIGGLYMDKGEFDLGEKYYKKSEELDPSSFLSKRWLSNMYTYLKEYGLALEYANETISLRPESVGGYLEKLDALLHGFGDLEKCREVINEAENSLAAEDFTWWFGEKKYIIELYSRDYQTLLTSDEVLNYMSSEKIRLAEVYFLLDQPDNYLPLCDSLKIIYEQQTKERPDNVHDHWVLGRVYSFLDQKKEALRESQKAIDLNEMDQNYRVYPYPYINLIHILILFDEPDAAIDRLEYLLSNPDWYSIWDVKLDPFLDPLRDHPRFQELIKKYEDTEG